MGPELLFAAAAIAVGGYAVYYRRGSKKVTNDPVFASFGFNSLKLRSTETLNHDTKRLIFELPNPNVKSGLGLTSAVLAVSRPSGLFPVIRPYTPTNDLDEPGIIELLVKKYSNGKQSTYLHSLQPGDSLTLAPIKGYAWKPNAFKHIALVAGGQGITPCYQLARHILKNPEDQTKVTLVWGVNSEHDILLGKQLDQLAEEYPGRLKSTFVVAKPAPETKHPRGFINKEILERAGAMPAQANSEKSGVEMVFVCGPPPMETAIAGTKGWFGGGSSGVLGELGYTSSQIHRF